MKVLTVVGARPQFIKASAVSRAIAASPELNIDEVMVHTGQHHDNNMSQVFFDELGIPPPQYNLAIAGGGHGEMTGRMMLALEPVMLAERPDWVLIYGDTNSTLAGALVAAKLKIPIAHVEAGLRSFNMGMPEEVNRILADRVSTLLFCPTIGAVENLEGEGLVKGVHLVGDVMYDVALHFKNSKKAKESWAQAHGLPAAAYALVTCHRAENTDDLFRLSQILAALERLSRELPIVVPLHPRTRKAATREGLLAHLNGCLVIEPLSYFDMLSAEQEAAVIVTDSGGVQKEAFFFKVPCITIRPETEWLETVTLGWNRLVPAEANAICSAVRAAAPPPGTLSPDSTPYGAGDSAVKIVEQLGRER